ncbi:MAG: indole-3-glycerol phosphate synthase TrpC [Leptospiraceae bacterium]|nr:indole-3-glycerol phosphate synthase TrpC [Leptospiraceae bacterium]
MDFPKPKYSLLDSLRANSDSIIAECKKASPSMGVIRENYDPVSIASVYESCGARAISVLTDQNFFQGKLDDLQRVSEAVQLPVIRKDFIIHEKQIREAARFGASAILLIVRILSQTQLKDLLKFTYSIGLEVLVEIHTKKEAEIATEVGAKIIGINTRDLDTFQIHQNLIEEVSRDLPKNVHIVGESGIKNRDDYLKMKTYVQSTLIGTYFMQKEDITAAYLDLLGK